MGILLVLADDFSAGVLVFPIFFLVPVLLAGWNGARRDVILLACALPAARLFLHTSCPPGLALGLEALNAAIRIVILAILGLLANRVAAQGRELSERVSQLEGLLPICAHCKRIRDTENQWIRIESYITRNSRAEFSHGICPACAQEHYGMTLTDDA